jgi:hypothetical protein
MLQLQCRDFNFFINRYEISGTAHTFHKQNGRFKEIIFRYGGIKFQEEYNKISPARLIVVKNKNQNNEHGTKIYTAPSPSPRLQ